MKKLILASKSPRRQDLLSSMGLTFTVSVADADETIPEGTAPDAAVKMLAKRKANAVFSENSDAVVVGADTVVYLPGENIILGKPRDEADAFCMLRRLSGEKHYVYTGVAVVSKERCDAECAVTEVEFRHITDEEITDYIATGEHSDKAGAYGVQSLGGVFVKGIKGEYFNVTGMPKSLTYELLRHQGIDVLKLNKAK